MRKLKWVLGITLILVLLLTNYIRQLPPPEPADLKAVAYADGIKLTWTKVHSSGGFEVYRSTDIDGEFELIDSVKENNFTDENLKKNTTYYYKVRTIKKISTQIKYSKYTAIAALDFK